MKVAIIPLKSHRFIHLNLHFFRRLKRFPYSTHIAICNLYPIITSHMLRLWLILTSETPFLTKLKCERRNKYKYRKSGGSWTLAERIFYSSLFPFKSVFGYSHTQRMLPIFVLGALCACVNVFTFRCVFRFVISWGYSTTRDFFLASIQVTWKIYFAIRGFSESESESVESCMCSCIIRLWYPKDESIQRELFLYKAAFLWYLILEFVSSIMFYAVRKIDNKSQLF